MTDPEYKLPTEFPVKEYKCGLKAGDKVKLVRDLVITDDYGLPVRVYPKDEIWTVEPGAKGDPVVVVWFRRADGKLHTWDDDEEIYRTFEKVEFGL